MSISYSASVVCGFPVTIEDLTQEVTKYNENDGTPYQVAVKSGLQMLHNGTIIGTCDLEHTDDFCPGEEYAGLTNGGVGWCNDEGLWLGIQIACVGGYGDELLSGVTTIVPDAVQEFADKHSITPQFFLVLNCV